MERQLPLLLAANEAYRESAFRTAERTPQPARHLVIVACMDARLDLFRALGLEVGDAHLLRNAGGRVSPDLIRSLIVSTHLLQTREVGVIHHTNCGLHGVTEEEVARRTGVSGVDFRTFADLQTSVTEDVAAIRNCGELPADVVAWGAIYDVDSGAVTPVDV